MGLWKGPEWQTLPQVVEAIGHGQVKPQVLGVEKRGLSLWGLPSEKALTV